MELTIDLGPMPVDAHAGWLTEGLRGLWDQSEFCDVELIAGGQTFLAHKPVLAAVSPSVHECLMQLSSVQDGSETSMPNGRMKLKLADVAHPEAVQAMLECIYGPPAGAEGAKSYSPANEDVNRDVLRLAQRFQITQLQQQACGWLMSNLSTTNVLQRLLDCEELGLVDVRDNILGQITSNPKALWALANDPEVRKAPAVLQDLLIRVLSLLNIGDNPSAVPRAAPKGQGSKAGRKVGT